MGAVNSPVLVQSEIYQLWNVQESLLQRYRSLFLAIQAILFSICAGALFKGVYFLALIAVIAGIVTLIYWRTTCDNRGKYVAFSQWLLLKNERDFYEFTEEEKIEIKQTGLFNLFKQFQKDNTFINKNISVNDDCYARLVVSFPRKILNFVLIGFFFVLWLYLTALVVGHYLKIEALTLPGQAETIKKENQLKSESWHYRRPNNKHRY